MIKTPTRFRFLILLVLMVLALLNSPMITVPNPSFLIMSTNENNNSFLSPHQVKMDILNGSLSFLESKAETDGWDFPSYSSDLNKYTGIAGGMAGVGLKLLEAGKSAILSSYATRLLNDAEEVAADLEESVIEINETHALWGIS